jgi:hypothetical protein
MLTRALCHGSDASAVFSLVVTAEVDEDLAMLLRDQQPLLRLVRFTAGRLRDEPNDDVEVVIVDEVTGLESGALTELQEDALELRVVDEIARRERGCVFELQLHRHRRRARARGR